MALMCSYHTASYEDDFPNPIHGGIPQNHQFYHFNGSFHYNYKPSMLEISFGNVKGTVANNT